MFASSTAAKALRRFCRLSLLVVLALGPIGCSTFGGGGDDGDDVAFEERPPEDLYTEAQQLLGDNDFEDAAKAFEEVERQHPYSEWATRAQLMAAYAYYEETMYDEAIAAARRFAELHPGNKDVPYAYYLVGMSYYERISDVGRDQQMTLDAMRSFDELVRRYPNSDYARDARLKMDLARDHLAGKEMEIGRYYQKKERYVAAINRFRMVIEQYQTTSHVPEALHRLNESYLALGLTDEARAAAAVLGYNFPDSDWYADSYALLEGRGIAPGSEAEGESWLSRLF
ncbi:MAG: outer membrane protein assembly factor BamD [Geminicoccaceae bacterium]